jgi:hypothetical protein
MKQIKITNRICKTALLAALGLASVTAAQALTYNGDLVVGFTVQSGNDLVYDLGSEASITNGETWNLTSALTAAGLNSRLSTVQWGVVGAKNVSGTRTSWLTIAAGIGTPNSVDGIGAWNAINGSVGTLVANDFSALGLGNYATPDSGVDWSWNKDTAQGATGGNSSFSITSQDPNTTGLGSASFWKQINDNSTPTQLGTFTLSSAGILTYNELSSNSTNAFLTSLVLSPAGTLSPAFASNVLSYATTEAYGNTPTVTVVNADLTATNRLIYNGTTNLLASGGASSGLTLTLGATNVVKVQVTAQDGVTVNTYQVNVSELPNLATAPKLTNSINGGKLKLSWPADRLGYRLLVQTNHLNYGISGNTNDWATVAGSTAITATNLPIVTTNMNCYYRLVYP